MRENTRKLIISAFMSILNENHDSRITVSMICRKAGVSRSTFDMKYNGINSLVVDILEMLYSDYCGFISTDNVDEQSRIKYILDIVFNYNALFYELLHSNNRKMFNVYSIDETLKNKYIKSIFNLSSTINSNDIIYKIAGTVAVINKWIDSGCRENTEYMSATLYRLTSIYKAATIDKYKFSKLTRRQQQYIMYITETMNFKLSHETLLMDKLYPQMYLSVVHSNSDEIISQINLRGIKSCAYNHFNEAVKLDEVLIPYGIVPIHFKGVIWSQLIYDNFWSRDCGDIDIFIEPGKFDEAISILIDNGYSILPLEDNDKWHHVVVKSHSGIEIEVHRNYVDDVTGLNMTLLENTCYIEINNHLFKTLDISACFVEMLYHIYMHVNNFINAEIQKSFVDLKRPNINLFIHDKIRDIYEMVVFYEKYSPHIDIEQIIEKLGIIPYPLHVVLTYTDKIFGDALPENLVKAKYLEHPNHILLSKEYDYSHILAENLEQYHYGMNIPLTDGKHCEFQLSMKDGKKLFDITKGKSPLAGSIHVIKSKSSLIFEYSVNRISPVVNTPDNDDPFTCDCVGLMYVIPNYNLRLNYIYAYPVVKENTLDIQLYLITPNGTVRLTDSDCIFGSILKTETGTTITLTVNIPDDTPCFYFDCIITSCNQETKQRETAISTFCDRYNYSDARAYCKLVFNNE